MHKRVAIMMVAHPALCVGNLYKTGWRGPSKPNKYVYL